MKRVKHIGPMDANIAIVGMAPSKDDSDSKVPFTGASGKLLSDCMRMIGMNRGECFMTHVSEVTPPSGKVELLKSIGVPIEDEIERLKYELSRVKPRVTIVLGNDALYHTTGKTGIYDWRGSPIPSSIGTGYIIPSLHPSGIIKGIYNHQAFLMFDLLKAKGIASVENWEPKERVYITNPSYNQVLALLENIQEYGKGEVTIDLETNIMKKDNGLTYIRCIGIATSDHYAMCIPIHTSKGSHWSRGEEIEIWKRFRDICQNKNIIKRVMNQNFELQVLYEWVGEIYPIRDAAIAHHLMQPETKKSLQFTTSLYTDMEFYKDEAKEGNWEDEITWIYNCKDCVATHEVLDVVEDELKQVGMWEFYTEYQIPLARLLFTAMMEGIKVNIPKVKAYKAEYEALLSSAQARLNELVGRPVNVNSPVAMKWLLYEKMGMPPQFDKKTKNITTNERAIERLASHFPSEIFNLVLEIRGYIKLLSTYLKEFWDSDGRCRADYRVWGTVTGRLASSSNVRGTGLNEQNIPGEIKDILESDGPDYYLVRIDLSQVESRLVAYMSEDPAMMECFESGKDIHKVVGSMVFNVPYENLVKESPERDKGKRLGHSANYIVGPGTFAAVAKIPMSSAKVLLARYYSLFNLQQWHESIENHLRQSRDMVTPMGRRRTFYNRWGANLFREATAHEPQSTACDHINKAAVRISQREDYKAMGREVKFLMQVHDELVYNVHKSKLDKLMTIIDEELKVPIIIHGRKVVIPITRQYGRNWKDVRSYE